MTALYLALTGTGSLAESLADVLAVAAGFLLLFLEFLEEIRTMEPEGEP
ncbi:MAG: hypothetical protein ACREFK_20690 [Stellaceae bacterium]